MEKWWYGILLRSAYALRLRYPAIWAQRWWMGENKAPRSPLPMFNTPEAIVEYAQNRFRYRSDQGKLGGWMYPLDWITHPEVFQHRLENDQDRDGDCDDYHWWAASCLAKIPDVTTIYLLSSGYDGDKGHATCVFEYRGSWKHLDYRIYPLSDPNDAPLEVAKRYTRGGRRVDVPWYVFESQSNPWRAVAIGPNGKVPV